MSRNLLTGTVTSKGQVTIPKPLRDQLGIGPGEVLEFEEREAGEIVARKTRTVQTIDAAYGVLKGAAPTDVTIERLRGKPDAI